MRSGITPEQEVRAIQEGRADWMAEPVPASLLPRVARRFAGQLHTNSTTETDFFQLNTSLPPFDDVRVRRALNLAIDRRAIGRIYGGGRGSDTDLPGAAARHTGLVQGYCPYRGNPGSTSAWRADPTSPAHSSWSRRPAPAGLAVTVWGWTDDPTISPRVTGYTAGVLRRLGYRVRVRLVPHSFLDDPRTRRLQSHPVDPSRLARYEPVQLLCAVAVVRRSDEPRLVLRLATRSCNRAVPTPSRRWTREAAAALWARIDRQATGDKAAWVPLVNPRLIDFVSARVRNYQFHPYWGILANQLVVE